MRRTCGRIHQIKVVNLDQQIDQFDRLSFSGQAHREWAAFLRGDGNWPPLAVSFLVLLVGSGAG
jgi:hypothetical protein